MRPRKEQWTGQVHLERDRDDRRFVVATGEVDVAVVPELRECLAEAVGDGSATVVVDLSQVTFIDSLSLSAILGARRRLGPGGRMILVSDQDFVLLILRAAGLVSVLEVVPTRAHANAFLER